MSIKTIFAGTFGAVALMLGTPANAVLLNFSLTGDYAASWQLESQQIPDLPVLGEGATYYDVHGVFPGSVPENIAEICFFNDALLGGIEIDYFDSLGTRIPLVITVSAQIYSGAETAPTLVPGVYAMLGYDPDTEDADPSHSYTLNVTIAPAAVPEPESWTMMIAGFALAGGVMRHRKLSARFA